MTTVDVAIIGSGQGGTPLASDFAAAGKTTVLIERAHLGGTCVNVGCTPTKTMIASGRVAYLARRSRDYGVDTGSVAIDMKAVRQRKRDIVEQWRSGSRKHVMGKPNQRVVFGEARFTREHELAVALNDGGEETFTADTIVIDAGGRPRPLDVPGANEVDILNSTTVMELAEVPRHLIVVGGGPIGLEFAQLFRRLGADVTVVHRHDRLLSREDDDIAEAMQQILEEDGITFVLQATPERVSREGELIHLELKQGDDTQIVSGSHILAAAGRVPNSDSLSLDHAGVRMDKQGHILTNDWLETNVQGIYALGDIRGGPKFTHISYDDYRVLKTNLIEGGHRSIQGRMVPYTVFTDPQLGRIGMSEQQAREAGRDVRIASMPMSAVARAVETGEPRGMMKAVVDAGSGRILGAAVLGLEGGEIASLFQLAMMGNIPYTVLRDGIFPHPGLAESLNNLFLSFRDEE